MIIEAIAKGRIADKEEVSKVAISRARGAIFCHVDNSMKICH